MPNQLNSESVLKNAALFTLLLFGLTACGGGSGSGDDTATSGGTTTEESTDTTGDATNEESTDTNGAEFIVLESMGIRTQIPAPDSTMVDYDFIAYRISGNALAMDIRVTNNSDNVITSVSCTPLAYKDDSQVGSLFDYETGAENVEIKATFVDGGHLRPGDSAIATSTNSSATDFTQVDSIELGCSSQDLDLTFVKNDPLVDIELIEWTADEFDRPQLIGQATNNSQTIIRGVSCDFILRNGNVVLYNVYIVNTGNIFPGNVGQLTGSLDNSIAGFDNTVLDKEDLFCSWVVL